MHLEWLLFYLAGVFAMLSLYGVLRNQPYRYTSVALYICTWAVILYVSENARLLAVIAWLLMLLFVVSVQYRKGEWLPKRTEPKKDETLVFRTVIPDEKRHFKYEIETVKTPEGFVVTLKSHGPYGTMVLSRTMTLDILRAMRFEAAYKRKAREMVEVKAVSFTKA